MDQRVKVRLELDPSCPVPEVVIRTDQRNELAERLISAVERCAKGGDAPLLVYDGNAALLISRDEVTRVYTEPRKLMVCTGSRTYEARCSLQEMEDLLDRDWFVRISRFEIINMEKVVGFDVSVSGTIRVTLDDGSVTWVARRYVHTIEQRLERLYAKGGHKDD